MRIGIQQFLAIAADLESDCPHIAKLFSRRFLVPLLKEGVVSTQHIKWPPVNEEMYAFDLYYKVIAEVFYFEQNELGKDWKQIKTKFESESGPAFDSYSQNEMFEKQPIVDALIESHRFEPGSQVFEILKLN